MWRERETERERKWVSVITGIIIDFWKQVSSPSLGPWQSSSAVQQANTVWCAKKKKNPPPFFSTSDVYHVHELKAATWISFLFSAVTVMFFFFFAKHTVLNVDPTDIASVDLVMGFCKFFHYSNPCPGVLTLSKCYISDLKTLEQPRCRPHR